MTSLGKNARVAGFLYLLLVLVGPLRLLYIPTTLIVSGNPSATASNIAGHELLFRCGIVGDLLAGFLSLLVGLALYRLMKSVDESYAALVMIFGALMVTPIYFANSMNDAAALFLARGTDFLSALEKPQRDALVMLFLRLHDHGVLANEFFWGTWLFPFGILVYRSRFLPRILGVWLILNGIAYLAVSFTGMLAPYYNQAVANFAFPVMFGEVAIMLWLLVMGAKLKPELTNVAS